MEWYEHLLGILAVFTCINWIIIMAAVRVGAQADERCKEAFANSMTAEKHPVVAIPRSLDRIADLPFLQRRCQRMPCAEVDTPVQPVTQPTEALTSPRK